MSHANIARTFDVWAHNGRAESMEHGHGDRARFEPSEHCPDWESKIALDTAGSSWIHGTKL